MEAKSEGERNNTPPPIPKDTQAAERISISSIGKSKSFGSYDELNRIKQKVNQNQDAVDDLEFQSLELSKNLRVDMRVDVDLTEGKTGKYEGYIRYIGITNLLDWFHGLWIGVELDLPGRDMHHFSLSYSF